MFGSQVESVSCVVAGSDRVCAVSAGGDNGVEAEL